MKTRLLGAAILIALAVIFVPMFFTGSPVPTAGDKNISLEIPPAPSSLAHPAEPVTASSAATTPVIEAPESRAPAAAQAPVPPDQPAPPVPPPSRRSAPTNNVPPAIKPSPSAPVIPDRSATPAVRKPPARKPQIPAHAPPPDAPAAKQSGIGHYLLNLSAYASTASAQTLVQKVQALGYPVSVRPLERNGKTLAHVIAGPFGSRSEAEAAAKQIQQAIPQVPVRLEDGAAAAAPANSAALAAHPAKQGGWAVQLAAVSSQSDAIKLRNQLQGQGIPSYVDSVKIQGKPLWRVRAGPAADREAASKLHDQIKAKLGLDGNIVGS